MKPTRQRHFTRRTCAEILLTALAIACGGAIATIWLFLKPVAVVEHLPPPGQQEFGQVYYIRGSRDKTRGASWVQKRQALLDAATAPAGRVITLNEDELNAWFASSARTRQIRGAHEPATVGQADFHIERGELQVAAPVTVRIFFLGADVIVQARGTFARMSGAGELADAAAGAANANVVMFSPAAIHAGSLPLHRIPGAKTFLLREVFASETLPSVGVAAWRRIESVKIPGKELQIIVSPES